jgi:hypothetical protein
VWHSVKTDSPDTVFVGRVHRDDEPSFNHSSIDPIRAARSHCDKILPWANRMGRTYEFWQGLNEPIIQSPEAMKRFADFEMERMRVMGKHGFRVVIGSFAVGNPPKFEYWNYFLPALETARHYGAALALHEYAWPTLYHEWPWYLLRHRKVYRGARKRKWYGLPDYLKGLPLLITECGLDGLIERTNPPRGWQIRYGHDPDRYLQQLAWYDRQLRRDPYVVGAALYCFCRSDDPSWGSYSIWPEPALTLARHAKPAYRLPKLQKALQNLPSRPPEHLEPPVLPSTPWPAVPTPVLTGKETDRRPDALSNVGVRGGRPDQAPPPPPPAPADADEDSKVAQAVEHLDRILHLLEQRKESPRTSRDE